MSLDLMEGDGVRRDYTLERLSMLQDGVFAIAMTLLALDLRPPTPMPPTLPALFSAMEEPLVAYAISFGFVSSYWVRQKTTFSRLARADQGLTLLTLLMLALVTLVPPVARAAVAVRLQGVGLQLWLSLLAALGATLALQWVYAAYVGRLLTPGHESTGRLGESLAQLVMPLGLGAVAVASSYGLLSSSSATIAIVVFLTLLLRTLLRRRRRGGPGGGAERAA